MMASAKAANMPIGQPIAATSSTNARQVNTVAAATAATTSGQQTGKNQASIIPATAATTSGQQSGKNQASVVPATAAPTAAAVAPPPPPPATKVQSTSKKDAPPTVSLVIVFCWGICTLLDLTSTCLWFDFHFQSVKSCARACRLSSRVHANEHSARAAERQ